MKIAMTVPKYNKKGAISRYVAELSIPPDRAQKTFFFFTCLFKNSIAAFTNFLGFLGAFINL